LPTSLPGGEGELPTIDSRTCRGPGRQSRTKSVPKGTPFYAFPGRGERGSQTVNPRGRFWDRRSATTPDQRGGKIVFFSQTRRKKVARHIDCFHDLREGTEISLVVAGGSFLSERGNGRRYQHPYCTRRQCAKEGGESRGETTSESY